ncbi:MAG TPA: Glu/Leu/Phe/Val dehydrogenase [Chitinophagales bacterium]|nr:Glu/Leu/Phe/Val dehydrogenase [Chitinophagales bacterium]
MSKDKNVIKNVEKREAGVLAMMEPMEHEQVMYFNDKETGLKGIIAVHNTVLGPSLGGCRIWKYENESDALWDVLRLSRGMTFKSAISGINLGGGKAVIIGDPKAKQTEAFWRRFGQFVDSLNGKYITAEDVGTSTDVMSIVMQETKHVTGKPISAGGSGDPSPFTAYGVFLGLKASVKEAFGSDSLEGKKVAVQGVGHVGYTLVQHLTKAGAKVYATDLHTSHTDAVAKDFGATIIDAKDIYDLDVDVYSPCALGATVNSDTIPRLKCQVIAGAANNQLADENLHGRMLMDRGIVYAPDFLINAGGVINCYREVHNLSETETNAITEKIYDHTLDIFAKSKAENIPPQEAAIKIAVERIEAEKAKKNK